MIRRGPVRRTPDGFVVRLGDDETELLTRLLDELRGLLTTDDPDAAALTSRLFPVANPDDPEREAEYQRLMRDELVASRLASIDAVEVALRGDRLDEAQLAAFMRSLNALRLVVGTALGVSDDEEEEEPADSPHHHLYGYLSWLLEHVVRTLSAR